VKHAKALSGKLQIFLQGSGTLRFQLELKCQLVSKNVFTTTGKFQANVRFKQTQIQQAGNTEGNSLA